MKKTQKQIAVALQISEGHLSDILNGNVEIGKRTAKAMGELTWVKWNYIMVMRPDEIRDILGL